MGKLEKALRKLFDHHEIRAQLRASQSGMEIQLRKGTEVGRILRTNGSQCKGRQTLGNTQLTFHELSTLLTEMECTLSSRPLTNEYKVEEEVLMPDKVYEPDDFSTIVFYMHN